MLTEWGAPGRTLWSVVRGMGAQPGCGNSAQSVPCLRLSTGARGAGLGQSQLVEWDFSLLAAALTGEHNQDVSLHPSVTLSTTTNLVEINLRWKMASMFRFLPINGGVPVAIRRLSCLDASPRGVLSWLGRHEYCMALYWWRRYPVP